MRLLLVVVLGVAGCRTQPIDLSRFGDAGGAPPPDLSRADLTRAPDLGFVVVDFAFRPGDLAPPVPTFDLRPGDEVNAPRGGAPLWCGGAQCFDQFCCVADDGSETCASGCTSATTAFNCDDATDCTGAICCLELGSFPRRTQCKLSCTGLELCKSTTDCRVGSGTICRRVDGLPDDTGACLPPD